MTVSKELISPYSYVGMKGVAFVPVSALSMVQKEKIVESIFNAVIIHFEIKDKQRLLKKDRSEPYITARHICAYLIKQMTGITDSQMTKYFNGRDRTTLIHSMRLIEGYIKIGEPQHLLNDIKIIRGML